VESPSTVLSYSWTTALCSSSAASSASIAVTLEALEGSEKDAIADDFFEIHMVKGKKEEKCIHVKKASNECKEAFSEIKKEHISIHIANLPRTTQIQLNSVPQWNSHLPMFPSF
jgi:hypothetical protein